MDASVRGIERGTFSIGGGECDMGSIDISMGGIVHGVHCGGNSGMVGSNACVYAGSDPRVLVRTVPAPSGEFDDTRAVPPLDDSSNSLHARRGAIIILAEKNPLVPLRIVKPACRVDTHVVHDGDELVHVIVT